MTLDKETVVQYLIDDHDMEEERMSCHGIEKVAEFKYIFGQNFIFFLNSVDYEGWEPHMVRNHGSYLNCRSTPQTRFPDDCDANWEDSRRGRRRKRRRKRWTWRRKVEEEKRKICSLFFRVLIQELCDRHSWDSLTWQHQA